MSALLHTFTVIADQHSWLVQVLRQPQGTYTPQQHALRVSPILVEPASAFGLHYCVFGLLRLRNRRLDRRLKSLNKKMKQLIHDLKVCQDIAIDTVTSSYMHKAIPHELCIGNSQCCIVAGLYTLREDSSAA